MDEENNNSLKIDERVKIPIMVEVLIQIVLPAMIGIILLSTLVLSKLTFGIMSLYIFNTIFSVLICFLISYTVIESNDLCFDFEPIKYILSIIVPIIVTVLFLKYIGLKSTTYSKILIGLIVGFLIPRIVMLITDTDYEDAPKLISSAFVIITIVIVYLLFKFSLDLAIIEFVFKFLLSVGISILAFLFFNSNKFSRSLYNHYNK